MTRVEEIEQEIYSLATRFNGFSGKYGDWARAIVNKWDGVSLPISSDSGWLGNISELSRLELVQLIVAGESERIGMVDHTGEWEELKKLGEEWLNNQEREREREREPSTVGRPNRKTCKWTK